MRRPAHTSQAVATTLRIIRKLPVTLNQRTVISDITSKFHVSSMPTEAQQNIMFDILVYLFENYYTPDSCPEADILAHKLAAAGFEHEDIHDALGWLYGLAHTTEQCVQLAQTPQTSSLRIYTDDEHHRLGPEAIGFITFLENSDALPAALREILIDRALAVQESPISIEKIKIIALMVLWSQEAEVDHLILEELLTDDHHRQSH